MTSEIKKMAQNPEQPSFLVQGIALLCQIQNENFSSEETIRQTYQLLKQSLAQTPSLPEPYLAMAYLLLLSGDWDSSTLMLKEALLHAPNNPDAHKMLDYITQAKHAPRPPQKTHIDWDRLHDQVAEMIVKHLHYHLKSQENSNQEIVNQHLFDKLTTLINTLNAYIQTLEKEFDVMDLRHKIRPLNVLWKRHKQSLDLACAYASILGEIETELKRVNALIQKVQDPGLMSELEREQELEAILDQCDRMADKLDDLNKQGQDIQKLEIPYNQWIEKVTDLQGLLDEYHF
jgi:hypothetical protein